MEVSTIDAIANLWPLALIIFLTLFMFVFRKQIRVILERRSVKVKRGDTEISLEGDTYTTDMEDSPPKRKVVKELQADDKPASLIEPEDIDEHDEQSTDDLWYEMYSAIKKGDIDEGTKAFELLDEAEKDPTERRRNEAFFYYLLALQGDTNAFEKLKEFSSDPSIGANANNWLGICYEVAKDYQNAVDAYESAAESAEEPKFRATCTVNHARTLVNLEPNDTPLNILYEAISDSDQDEERAILYQGIASVYEKLENKINKAISLENALKFRANDTNLRFKVAYAYSDIDFDQMAMYHYETLLRFESDNNVARNNLGVAYQALGMQAHSVEAYKRASDNAETIASANLAYAFITAGLFEEAKELLDKAMKEKHVHENVGTALAELKDHESSENRKKEEVLEESTTLQMHLLSHSNAMSSRPREAVSMSETYLSNEQIEFEVVAAEGNLTIHWEKNEKKFQIIGTTRNHAIEALKNEMRYSIRDKSEIGYKEVGTAYGYFSEDQQFLTILTVEDSSLNYIELSKSESVL